MATYGWGTNRPVIDWLYEEGFRFDFYQAVKLLEQMRPERNPIGETADPAKEPVHFRSKMDLTFPATDINEVNPPEADDDPAEMIVNFLSLAGNHGPLPAVYTEMLLERLARKDTAMRDFLDIFNHRLVSLMYRVRKIHRIGQAGVSPDRDHISQYLLAVMGLGTEGVQGRMRIRDRTLMRYAGLLAQKPRSMIGLEALLSDYFKVPVKGRQFMGQWHQLDESQWTRIGHSGHNQHLGRDAVVLGKRVWDQQAGFRLQIGPLSHRQFVEYLPTGWGFQSLCELTKLYINDGMDYTFRLILRKEEMTDSRLGRNKGPQLGWTSWLKTGPWIGENPHIDVSPYVDHHLITQNRCLLFAHLPQDEYNNLLEKNQVRTYPSNSVIIRQDTTGDSLYVIVRGSVDVSRQDRQKKVQRIGTLHEGDVFGEIALLTGKPRSATAVTVSESVILSLSKKTLVTLIARYPKIGEELRSLHLERTKGLV